jgi:XTP/dITP diphosphohydrolase
MKLLLATRNKHKILEIKDAFKNLNLEILTLDNFPQIPEIEEDGKTLTENALKKAREVYKHSGILSLADDTGLEVDFLNGAPGVYSARFAGEKASYSDNCKKLLKVLENVSLEKRTATFKCIIALVGNNLEKITEGVCKGRILNELRGTNGFGYDPLFYVEEYGKTFAEMELELKNKISHRARALQKMAKVLKSL